MSELACVQIGAIGPLGSGGMGSKINSARIATSGGVETIIANGTRPGVLRACLAGGRAGTRFPARPLGLHDYKLWLLYGKPARGTVAVDAGAAKAIKGKGSLLPVGIIRVDGEFAVGDAVTIVDERGAELAKGLVNYSSLEMDRVKGLQSSQVAEMLPQASPEAIHRDYLVRVC
jgi:glutamate 5-kinase